MRVIHVTTLLIYVIIMNSKRRLYKIISKLAQIKNLYTLHILPLPQAILSILTRAADRSNAH